jgi:hypothetical protein
MQRFFCSAFPYRRANTRLRASGNVPIIASAATPAPVNATLTCSHARSNPRLSRTTTNASPTRRTVNDCLM